MPKSITTMELRLEFGDVFDLKMKIRLQPKYTFSSIDESSTRGDDTSSFRLRRARLVFSGNLLGKQFSYKLNHDLASSGGSGKLLDAWLQWNLSKAANVRMGQFKVPNSRQALASSASLQFIERSNVTNHFTDDVFGDARQNGAMVHGKIGSAAKYAVGMFNGNSDGEGTNARGVDNNHSVYGMVSMNMGEYGSRKHEGAYGHAGKRLWRYCRSFSHVWPG